MTKYERLYTADEVDGMIARAKAAAAQPATVAQLCEVAFSVKREAIEICKQQGHLEAAHAIQGLLAVNAHVDPATPPAAQPAAPDFKAFKAWANDAGYDTAYTNDGVNWICLNPMTADLWKAWQAAHGIKENT
jgi:hypothetical protein